MPRTFTKRDALGAGGGVALAALAGCFGISHRIPPDEGTIHIGGAEWASGKTLRVVARTSGDVALDRSYTLPDDDAELTVKPAPYELLVSLDGEQMLSYTWEVTSCQSELYIMFASTERNGISIDTSNC